MYRVDTSLHDNFADYTPAKNSALLAFGKKVSGLRVTKKKQPVFRCKLGDFAVE